MVIKYKWGKLGRAHWFRAFPFVIVAINILISVVSDFESYAHFVNENRANTLATWCMFAQVFPWFQEECVFRTVSVQNPTITNGVAVAAPFRTASR